MFSGGADGGRAVQLFDISYRSQRRPRVNEPA